MRHSKWLSSSVTAVWLLSVPLAAWGWQMEGDGAANNVDQALAVTVDGSNNVIAAGRLQNVLTADDLTVIKLDWTSGAEIWRREIDSMMGTDEARSVAVDGVGDVLVGGLLMGATSGDLAVLKLDGSTGATLWTHVINGSANGFDQAFSVEVDGSGDVIAAGVVDNAIGAGDFAVLKLAGSTGAQLWRQDIDGTAHDSERAASIVVNGAGDVFAAGFLIQTTTDADFTVIKFSGSSGAELWRQVIDGTIEGQDQAMALALDGGGDVFAAGFLTNNTIGEGENFTVIKFSGLSGTELWRQEIDQSMSGFDLALAAKADSSGNVVVSGSLGNAPLGANGDLAVIKFSGSSGTELWRQQIAGVGTRADAGWAVSVDASGDLVVAGQLTAAGNGADFALLKLSGSSGAELWRQTINGTASGSDGALALTLDWYGDVVATGFLTNTGSVEDFAVIKLNGSDGADFVAPVCGNGANESGEECDDGNLVDGDCCSSTCELEPAATVCRPSAGPCDLEESCTGSNPTCPADAKNTAECRVAVDLCDVAESCDGVSNDCPADAFAAPGTICDNDPCTVAECDGNGQCVISVVDPDSCLDDFLCYKARTSPGAPRLGSDVQATLDDQFESKLFALKKKRGLCNPADKDSQGVIDWATHLTAYKITRALGESPHMPQTNLRVVNQFGEIFVDTLKEDRLLVPAAKDLTTPVTAPDNGTHDVDHYKCYRVRVTRGTPKFPKGLQASVVDQFSEPKTVDLKRPQLLCTPADKDGEGIKHLQVHLLCYKIKPARGEPKHTRRGDIFTADQFIEDQMDTKKEELLCVPSLKNPPASP